MQMFTTLGIVIGVAGFLVGVASLVWMIRNWLDKRFTKLDRRVKKHDNADKKRARRLDDIEDSLLALNGKMDQALENAA